MKNLIVVSGRSGSGKSTALHLLEDIGYYCVDNLPLPLLSDLLKNLQNNATITHIAVGVDARNSSNDFAHVLTLFSDFEHEFNVKTLYLDAKDETLVQRFQSSRRPHPLVKKGISLSDALASEQEVLMPLMQVARQVIYTDEINIHELREKIRQTVDEDSKLFYINFISFGFKRSTPAHCDFIFDVRILPNPYWQNGLRDFSGKDSVIQQFFAETASVQAYIDDLYHLLAKWGRAFEKNDRSFLTVGIGCTGGQHRSVYVVEQLVKHLSADYQCRMQHRDIKPQA